MSPPFHRLLIRRLFLFALLVVVALFCACSGEDCSTCAVVGTVRGVAVYSDGRPVEAARVALEDRLVVTGRDGVFLFNDVTIPYDIGLVERGGTRFYVYKGITSRESVLQVSPQRPGTVFTYISGRISGAPESASVHGQFVFTAPGGYVDTGCLSCDLSGEGDFQLRIDWSPYVHGFELRGALILLRWQRDRFGNPVEYLSHTVKPLTLRIGETLEGLELRVDERQPLESVRLRGTVTLPEGYRHSERLGILRFGAEAIALSQNLSGFLEDDFDLLVPDLPGTDVMILTTAGDPERGAYSLLRADGRDVQGGLPLEVEPAPLLLEPEDEVHGVTSATFFRWHSRGGGVHRIDCLPVDSAHPLITVFTTADELSLPDLTVLGGIVPAGATYNWRVVRFYPAFGMDRVTQAGFWNTDGLAVGGEARSETREFVTAVSP